MLPTTPFKGGYRLTQTFGKRPEYYRQFGFNGHEGLDLVPLVNKVLEDKDIYAVEDGEVLRDVDPGERFDAYGYLTAVWNPLTKRCWWYAHNAFNLVEPGQKIKRGQKIARMGGSGNVQGDHLHLGLTMSDENKVRLNQTNGYKGFIDPEPALKELNQGGVVMANTMTIDTVLFSKLVGNSGKWDLTVKYVELPTDPALTSFEDVQRVVAGYKSRGTDVQNQINAATAELSNRVEQVSRLKDQALNDLNVQKTLLDNAISARIKTEESLGVVQGQVVLKQNQIDAIAKEKGELNTQLVVAQNSASDWQKKYNDLLTTHAVAHITLADAILILAKSFFGWAKNVQLKKTEDLIDVEELMAKVNPAIQ
ncbi:MAG TPA: M23 family metallopeptidase [Vitreimonas sp.]|nr:M23 family metallopeptidase [Vitreimonas sp.]